MRSSEVRNAVNQEVFNAKQVYNQLINDNSKESQRFADDFAYQHKLASDEYNNTFNSKMQEALNRTYTMDKTGALNTPEGLFDAKSQWQQIAEDSIQGHADYYAKLQYINQLYNNVQQQNAENNKIDSTWTNAKNDTYLYNSQ